MLRPNQLTVSSKEKFRKMNKLNNSTVSGTEKGGKRRRVVVKLNNSNLGTTKMIDKFNKSGELKTQKLIDRDASGKKLKVTKKKYACGTSCIEKKIIRAAAKAGIGKNAVISPDRQVRTTTKYK